MKRITLFTLFTLFLSFPVVAKAPEFVEWDNPLPRFTDLNMDIGEVAQIVEEGMLLITLPRQEMKLWSKGKVRNFEDVRIAVTATVMDAPPDVIKKQIMRAAEMDEYMPQISDSEIVGRQGEDFMAEFVQSYKLPLITMKAKFNLQHTMEENGDISVLLHKGDIDSGVARWEFIPLKGGQRTLVIYSYWGDLKSAGLAFKIILNSQPELEVSMVPIASAMVLMQLKDRVEGNETDEKISNEGLPLRPEVPLYTEGALPIDTLVKLMSVGTVVMVHPRQWIQGEEEPHGLLFSSGFNTISKPPEEVGPLAANYARIKEYFNWVKKVDIEKKGKVDDVTMRLKVSVGPVFLNIINKVHTYWNEDRDVLRFQSSGGDIDPMHGAWELIPYNDGKESIMVFTNTGLISDDAGWMLRMMRSLPLYDLIITLHTVITIIEKQEPWLYRELGLPAKPHHVITPSD